MNKLFFAALLGSALLTGAAQAQERPPAFPDANGDGFVTKDEMVAAAEARLGRYDTDKDGTLSAAELAATPGGGRGLARSDTDGDGAVTLDEARASSAKRFNRIDANHDGKIDKAEMDASRARTQAMRGNN